MKNLRFIIASALSFTLLNSTASASLRVGEVIETRSAKIPKESFIQVVEGAAKHYKEVSEHALNDLRKLNLIDSSYPSTDIWYHDRLPEKAKVYLAKHYVNRFSYSAELQSSDLTKDGIRFLRTFSDSNNIMVIQIGSTCFLHLGLSEHITNKPDIKDYRGSTSSLPKYSILVEVSRRGAIGKMASHYDGDLFTRQVLVKSETGYIYKAEGRFEAVYYTDYPEMISCYYAARDRLKSDDRIEIEVLAGITR